MGGGIRLAAISLRKGRKMKTISIDIETRSGEDISKNGVYRYTQSADFAILLFGYAVDGGEVNIIDLAHGERIPQDVLDALTDERVEKWAFNANSATAPGIVDASRQPILERSEVYSGVYGRASINFYAFNTNGNKGIACGLNNLQKIRDGESLGGKTRAEDDFADEDEDFLS